MLIKIFHSNFRLLRKPLEKESKTEQSDIEIIHFSRVLYCLVNSTTTLYHC